MKKLIAIVAVLLVAPGLASAQGSDHPSRVQGYVFLGEGPYSEDSADFRVGHVGGGGEVLLYKGLGIESEVGAMGRPGEGGVGIFSIDPSYQFLRSRRRSKLVPFVEAGYSRAFGNFGFTYSQDLLNFGGGIYYWPFKRVGLRLDFRDYVDHAWGYGVTTNYPAFRVGLALR